MYFRRITMKSIKTYCMLRKKESRKMNTGMSLLRVFLVLVKAKRD